MRKATFAATVIFLSAATAATPAAAQTTPARDGWWGTVGGGVGFNLTESSEGEHLTGFAVHARGGRALSARWLVGGDVIGWFYSERDVDLTRGFAGGTVRFYPSSTGRFWFEGGVGGAFSRVSAGVASDGTTWGFGSVLGLGYDLRLGDGVALTLGAEWLFQDVSIDTKSDNQLAMLTVGLTFH